MNQLSQIIRQRNHVPPALAKQKNLQLNMSQVEEDLNESNVTARNTTQEEIKASSSYFLHQQPDHDKLSFQKKTKDRLASLMKNVHRAQEQEHKHQEQQQQQEQEITPQSSIRSSDLSSEDEDAHELKSPKDIVTPCRLSFIKAPSKDSNIKLSSITVTINLTAENAPHSFFQEATITKKTKFNRSAIHYLFKKKQLGHIIFNIDKDYQPNSP